jgi:hypothetical protein
MSLGTLGCPPMGKRIDRSAAGGTGRTPDCRRGGELRMLEAEEGVESCPTNTRTSLVGSHAGGAE